MNIYSVTLLHKSIIYLHVSKGHKNFRLSGKVTVEQKEFDTTYLNFFRHPFFFEVEKELFLNPRVRTRILEENSHLCCTVQIHTALH